MALSDDVFPPDDRCEICGAELDDEIVIQEFADGSLARLCAECAAGAALDTDYHPLRGLPQSASEDASLSDSDPLDMTKELLTPVVDLIALQGEMQAALERLASSLERFAAGVLIENLDKTALVEDRVQTLERELERTRARLQEAESLLSTAATAPADAAGNAPPVDADPALETFGVIPETRGTAPPAEVVSVATLFEATDLASPTPGVPAAAISAVPIAPDQTPVVAPPGDEARGFRLEEVQAVQRYFNESPFTGKIRDVRRSLGKPQANLTRAVGAEPRAFVTVTWNIVWYQYLVDLRRDIPADERVILHREGMDLDELADHFKDKNASLDDDGRLDASELEVRLLSDPMALITEMTPAEEQALEDATEEIWDQRISPEFKWDS